MTESRGEITALTFTARTDPCDSPCIVEAVPVGYTAKGAATGGGNGTACRRKPSQVTAVTWRDHQPLSIAARS
jgi:hypothetical protein